VAAADACGRWNRNGFRYGGNERTAGSSKCLDGSW
jgi:hypothetical protein